jgi:hypothetical protein
MRTHALAALLIGSVSILAACTGSQLPLSVSSEGLASRQSPGERIYNIIHSFSSSPGDGSNPSADLINVKGVLYGTTDAGSVRWTLSA